MAKQKSIARYTHIEKPNTTFSVVREGNKFSVFSTEKGGVSIRLGEPCDTQRDVMKFARQVAGLG